ncbi:MAG: histidine--tRNA ligase [Candidatus Omnitrophica bacterium]|nr:histidine--tRNA ligase [Candidatus Omnitrophota bacterium]MBU4488763.1 histidine--tRNA ligase [Candidatus Omnitrophota bacterium]MCG2705860.1 histidine--tRNA ligase [Candidatus Omnitrophota bacterium]
MEKIQSLKGMSDILPPDVYLWQHVEEAVRRFLARYGYKEIRTPMLEESVLFNRSIGEETDIVNKEMYSFIDKGGRNIALRPEGTAPIVRSFIQHNIDLQDLVKLYYVGPMFRSERPQKGRSRQFHQIGVEAIGSSNPYVDAGMIVLMKELLLKIGISGFEVKLNSLGCSADKKKFAEALHKHFSREKSRLCDDCKVRLDKNVLRILDCKVESCRALVRNSPKAKDFLCESCVTHYTKVKELLTKHTPVEYKEDGNIVRGLDYYTGTVFEVSHTALGAQDAIAAGGRYDNLIEDFGGKKTGAIGFAIGMERLLMALPPLKREEILAERNKQLDLFAVTTSSAAHDEAYKAVEDLRSKEDIFCEINYDAGRSLKSQMNLANKKNARFVVIFGDEELKKGEVVLRNMKTAKQVTVRLDRIYEDLKRELKRA